jgi:hypothetical protein
MIGISWEPEHWRIRYLREIQLITCDHRVLYRNAGYVFRGSQSTVGQLDVTEDEAINEQEESVSLPGAIPRGGQRCLLSN